MTANLLNCNHGNYSLMLTKYVVPADVVFVVVAALVVVADCCAESLVLVLTLLLM